jgi:large subunit ribosomal protein L33
MPGFKPGAPPHAVFWRVEMPKGNRSIISLECPVCKRRNYSTTKNKRKSQDKLELSKFCRWCRKHTDHKEGKV